MDAKMYAEEYNKRNPPKKVDFLAAYVMQLMDRQGEPICAVEKFIEVCAVECARAPNA